MLIFNTTFWVSDKVYGTWMKWVIEEHLPFMLNSGYFSQPQIAKVLSNEEQEGTSFSVQFLVDDMDTLFLWNKKYGAEFQSIFSGKFADEAIFFTTTLELIKHQ